MSTAPIETLRGRLRNHQRRLQNLERKVTWPIGTLVTGVVAVATLADAPDTAVAATYVVDTNDYHFQGATHTVAEWQAMHAP